MKDRAVIAWLTRRNREVAEQASPLLNIFIGALCGLLALIRAAEAVVTDRPWYAVIVAIFTLVSVGWFRRGLKART